MRPLQTLWVALTTLLLIGTGCPSAEPPTEILVGVRSDLMYPAEIESLRISIYDRAGKMQRAADGIDLRSQRKQQDGSPFPLTFSLSSVSPDESSFRLVVTGLKGKSAVAEAQRFLQFERRSSDIVIELTRSCLGMLCRNGNMLSDRTCLAGSCGDIPSADPGQVIDPSKVPDGGSDAALGPSKDAAGDTSTGVDAGPPVACMADSNCAALLKEASPQGCASAKCNEGKCELRAIDADGDGHAAKSCTIPGQQVTTGDDCDDADESRSPTAWDGPAAGERADACDTIDNDCDGNADEEKADGKSCTCDPSKPPVSCSERADGTPISWPAGAPVGNCKHGTRTCQDGVLGPCVGAVQPATKDECAPNDDANCNGKKNEGCTCRDGEEQPCGSAVGDCELGVQRCVNGSWGECAGDTKPSGMDSCEPGSDADCDGQANEGCECVTGATSTCGEALKARGDCAMAATRCIAGKWDRVACEPRGEEICDANRRDEDCDGRANPMPMCRCNNGQRQACGFALFQLGRCAFGWTTCMNGQWGDCSVEKQERDLCVPPDVLSGVGDETCNGRSNEGCDCLRGETRACQNANCMGGTQTCNAQRGEWGPCERCNTTTPDGGMMPGNGNGPGNGNNNRILIQ